MTIEIASLDSHSVDSQKYGGKAHWLWQIHHLGCPVPPAFFLPAVKDRSGIDFSNETTNSQIKTHLQSMKEESGRYGVAIRSSATVEDSFEQTYAGHFKSKLGSMTYEEIQGSVIEVIESLDIVSGLENVAMGVVVQRLISPKFSGVIFSSDPLSNFKGNCVISTVRGRAERLVSGREPGTDIKVKIVGDSIEIPDERCLLQRDRVEELCRTAKKLEKNLRFPLDIEWCIDEITNDILYLQCRPATSSNPISNSIIRVSSTNEDEIPPIVRHSDKLAIRLMADQKGILLSNADLICLDLTRDSVRIPSLSSVQRSKEWNGYTTVLLYPEKLDGKIIRCFLGEKWAQALFLGCQRYAVRAYPEYDLGNCISGIARMVSEEYWGAVVMLQEVYRAEYTGIARMVSENCVIEVARGFFVAKGIVPVSQYILDSAGAILHTREIRQTHAVNILGGHVVEETIPSELSLVALDSTVLKEILKSFRPLWETKPVAVEFGLMRDREDSLIPYLIDFVPVSESESLDTSRVLEGVISKGKITGSALVLQKQGHVDSLSFHYSDEMIGKPRRSGAYVIFADLPDISLLGTLEEFNERTIGFVFKQGSALCHLSIVLRERGIPAVILDTEFPVRDGETITVDALTPSLRQDQRVQRN